MRLSAVVLAAGAGTRLHSSLPKVVHPVAGHPMLDHVLRALTGLSTRPAPTVVVLGSGADIVRSVLAGTLTPDVTFAHQPDQRGTGDAVRVARAAAAGMAEAVLVLYGDVPLITSATLEHLLAAHAASPAAITFLTSRPADPGEYGRVVRAADGTVASIVEYADATPAERAVGEVNAGVYVFSDAWLWLALAALPPAPGGEVYLTDLVARALADGQAVTAILAADADELAGVNTRADLARAEAALRTRIRAGHLAAGVTMLDPASVWIDDGVTIGADTVLWPHTFLLGDTHVGAGCCLGPSTWLTDTTVGDGVVAQWSVIEGAVVGAGSDVGPFAHLRAGARLAAGVHVGNFGEVKNATLAPGVRMGHFGYLGDADVGAGANIGAGTVTCNFDGEAKHHTTIGPAALIGSDTLLVAPVTVGAGARTGAGSVVTHDVAPGTTVVGAPARPLGESPPGDTTAGTGAGVDEAS